MPKLYASLNPPSLKPAFFYNIPAPKELRPYVISYDAGHEICELTYMEGEEKDG